VSSLYLHSNVTSHKWALEAKVELLNNAMEILLITSQIPRCLDNVVLDVFMNFIIMFMENPLYTKASPLYVENPYLREKMVEVLYVDMQDKSKLPTMVTRFEGHHLAQEYLVFNLMKLYVDIEITGSHT